MNRTMLLTLGLLVGCATPAPYPVEDFRALEKQQSWRELRTSLAAVAPSKRDEQWGAFLATAAAAELKDTDVARSPETVLDSADEILKLYPVLKTSKVYMAQRAETGLEAFKVTFGKSRHSSGDDEWLTRLRAFVEKDTVTPQLAQRAAKDVVLTRLIPAVAFPLYQLAFARDGDAVCDDPKLPEVMLDVVEGDSWAQESKEIVTGRCFSQLRAPFTEALTKGENRHLVKYGCRMLAGRAELAEVLATACTK
jgi:hypothetical protein